MNWTILDGKVTASTPQFLGANPAVVHSGPMQGTQVLKVEQELAFKLVESLNEEQQKSAVISSRAPQDILTSADSEAAMQEELGIAYGQLDSSQKEMLMNLITEYANVQVPDVAEERLDEIKETGLDSIKFAWMGGLDRGDRHYYRIQSKTFLIEYDNFQNDANHIHCVWRDFDGDFGLDVLKKHYEEFADASNPGVHRH